MHIRDRQNVEHGVLCSAARRELSEEGTSLSNVFGQLRQRCLRRGLGDVSREDEDLESGIGRRELLDVLWTCVRRAYEYLRHETLADRKLVGKFLVGDVDDIGLCIVNANAAGEETEGFERTAVGCEYRATSHNRIGVREERVVRDTVLILFRSRLPGEECRELAIEVDEVLRVLPARVSATTFRPKSQTCLRSNSY